MMVNDVSPPRCFTCDAALTTTAEMNRRIDWGTDLCDACLERDIEADCWCSYGWYLGGDPRQFQPDEENAEAEIAAWRLACEAWERGESVQPAAEEHGPWTDPETGKVTIGARPSPTAIGACHAPRAYGMGAIYCEQHQQSRDAWKQWPLRRSALESSTSLDPHCHACKASTPERTIYDPEARAQVHPSCADRQEER